MNSNKQVFPSSLSHWEIERYFNAVDLIVVGSGIVGLTTAIFYKKHHPKHKVIVLERGFLPSGASTKNAGFACFGSVSEILSDLQHSTESEVLEVISKRLTGLNELKKLVGEEKMSYQPCGGYEIFRPEDQTLYDKCNSLLSELNQLLKRHLNLQETYTIESKRIKAFGFSGIPGLIKNQYEGAIDIGKMMFELLKLAQSLDVLVLNGIEVTDWSNGSGTVNVSLNDQLQTRANKLHFATNGFASKLFPQLDVKPARAQVLITKPIPNLKIRGTFHMDEGFYYFRNVGDRILLGGGRNLDFEGETTSELETTEQIQNQLEKLLSEHLLPETEFEIEHRWAGIMGVGNKKQTIIKQVSENVSCAVRLGGMGMAIGTSVGKDSAQLLAQN